MRTDSPFHVVERRSPFIRQFGGPGDNGIVCFKFWQAVVASGCPGECAYCFLQTQTPYRRGLYELKGTLFSNLDKLTGEAVKWLASQSRRSGLIVGENQDGLAFERPYKRLLGITPLEILVPAFGSEHNTRNHTLVVLSKFTTTEYAEASVRAPPSNVVFSWSLSLPTISKRYEKKVAPLKNRLAKAVEMRNKGWRIRFRLDALAPVPAWREDLRHIVDQINRASPEMLTIGALRASNAGALRKAARAGGRDATIFDHIHDKDPSGFKYRTGSSFQVEAFQAVREQLDPSIRLGLCKEDYSIWKEVGVTWDGCHCLASSDDSVTKERSLILVQLAGKRGSNASGLHSDPRASRERKRKRA